MYLSHVCKILALACLISGICGDWEVLNDVSDVAADDLNLREELLLPVDAAVRRVSRAKQRSLTSLDQNRKENQSQDTELRAQAEHHQHTATTSTTNTDQKHKVGVRLMTSKDVSTNHGIPSDNNGPAKNDDVIDLADEGFLSADRTNGQHSPNSRKLAQFSQDNSNTNTQDQNANVETMSQKSSSEHGNPDQKDSEISQQILGEDTEVELVSLPSVSEKTLSAMNLKVACVDETSWECLMFKEDFLAMQGDANLSRRASVHERAKRQSSSNYRNSEITGNIWNSRNLLDCEGGDCFSGNGTAADEEEIAPEFRFKSTTKTKTNMTKGDLTEKKKEEIAKELKDKLTAIYDTIPGFKEVDIKPSNIYINSDGDLIVGDVEVVIDGGNGNYTGNSGPDVRDQVAAALQDANDKYKNITIDGQPPINDFNATEAAQEVEKQASEPCKIKPSPCSFGYGRCEVLPAKKNNGIRVKCIDNCVNFNDCHNGTCDKDKAGAPMCNCTQNFVGLYCDKENKTGSNRDPSVSPDFSFSSKSVFPTTKTEKDLTPDVREALAKQLEVMLTQLMNNFPGFKEIKVDPNLIHIVNGTIVMPWDLVFNSGAPAFAGKSPEQIGDIVKSALQNVSDSYRKSVIIDGQAPIEDLDSVDAGNQVEAQARDPCSVNPCTTGYGHCEALSATQVKCVHNCNARPDCQHDGTCQLDSTGAAVCQCTRTWAGENCELETSESKELDGGKIAGVVLGCALVAAALISTLCYFLLCGRRGQNDINFSHYTDPQSSGKFSNVSSKIYVIDRPAISNTALSLYGLSLGPNSANFSRPSSHGTSNGSGGSAPGNRTTNPFHYSHA